MLGFRRGRGAQGRDRDGIVLAPSGVVRRHARTLEQRMQEERALLEQRLAEEARGRAALEGMVRRLSAQRDKPDTTT